MKYGDVAGHARVGEMENNKQELMRCDVLVIGGGPAGSTISALLAEKGWRVTLLEKDHHPRFHIGESLLPMTLPFLERLGVLEEVERIGIRKYAGEFSSIYHGKTVGFQFADALDKQYPYAFEVRRSEFDHLLLRNSAAKGAVVHEGVRVTGVTFAPGVDPRVTARDGQGREQVWEANYVVDASGRDTLLARQLGSKRRNARHNSAAMYAHFSNAERHPGLEEGNITVYWFDHGWFWMIPLKDGTMSVGAVCWSYYLKSRKVPLEQFFLDTIQLCPGVAERLHHASLASAVTGTGNYSYQSEVMTGERFIMVGDAFAFIDPVFSSGVHLAMNSAVLGADLLDRCLREPAAAPRLRQAYERKLRRGLKTFSWFIYRMTMPAMRDLFMNPHNVLHIQGAVTSMLAGDLFRETPVHGRLTLFKVLYYLRAMHDWRRNLAAFQRRRQNARASAPAFQES